MLDTNEFIDELNCFIDFYTGVPDSLLKDFCACLGNRIQKDKHIIAANEGNSVALAAGHYIASQQPACVYMQNSGLGNVVNPLLSLVDEAVYGIPMLMIIGWRGEPGVKDEPQHISQGRLTIPLLETMNVAYLIVDKESNVKNVILKIKEALQKNKPFALVVKKGSFSSCEIKHEVNDLSGLRREQAIETLLSKLPNNYRFISTTGKISRELFEIREKKSDDHSLDFLVVGSMGHTSQIALGVALTRKDSPICCLDGDGSVLMHMGALAINGSFRELNMLHIIINNSAHDTVGGQPTVMGKVDLPSVAKAVGYKYSYTCDSIEGIENVVDDFLKKPSGLSMIEIRVAKGARDDLGRPTISPIECKKAFSCK